jgi:hypothetical protein
MKKIKENIMNTIYMTIIMLLALGFTVMGQEDDIDNQINPDTTVQSDSISPDQSDSISPMEDTVKPLKKDAPFLLIKTKKDTVLILEDKKVNGFLKNIRKTIDKSRKQGYGGGGGFTPCMLIVNINPVKELIQKEHNLSNKKFDIGFGRHELFIGGGGMGYGGIGHGIRIGGGGWGGTRKYTSALYGPNRDSLVTLDVEVGMGGFLIEKAFVKEKVNYMIGGMFGGGGFKVSKSFHSENKVSAFTGGITGGEKEARASFTMLEIHGGLTYSVVSWFHVGVDANAMLFISTEAFGGSTDSFITPNGGARLRIMFGNIG